MTYVGQIPFFIKKTYKLYDLTFVLLMSNVKGYETHLAATFPIPIYVITIEIMHF